MTCNLIQFPPGEPGAARCVQQLGEITGQHGMLRVLSGCLSFLIGETMSEQGRFSLSVFCPGR